MIPVHVYCTKRWEGMENLNVKDTVAVPCVQKRQSAHVDNVQIPQAAKQQFVFPVFCVQYSVLRDLWFHIIVVNVG